MKHESVSRFFILAGGFLSYFLVIALYVESLSQVINEFGVKYLPIFLLGRAVMLAGLTFFNIGFSGKFSNRKIFTFVIFFFVIFFAILPFLKTHIAFTTGYFYFMTSSLFAFLDFAMVPLAFNFVNPVKAKVFLPLFSSFTDLGLIFGSYYNNYLTAWIPHLHDSFIPAILLLFVALFIYLAGYFYRGKIGRQIESFRNNKFRDEIKKSFEYIFYKSRFFAMVALSIILFVVLQNLIEFKLSVVLGDKVEPQLVEHVLSQILFAENFLRFVFTILFMKRILFRFGVIGTLLSFPIMLFGTIIVALFMHWTVITTALVYLVFSILYYGTYQLTLTQTFFLLPPSINRGIIFICTNMAIAVGSFFSALLLLLFYFYTQLESSINVGFIICFSLIGVFIVYLIRQLYRFELKRNLASDDTGMCLRAIDLLAENTQKNRGEVLLRELLQSDNLNQKKKEHAIYALGIINNPESIADLIPFLYYGNSQLKFYTISTIGRMLQKQDLKKYPLTKHRLLDAFKLMLVSDIPLYIKLEITSLLKYFEIVEIINFLEDNLLNNKDPKIKINTIETLASFHDRSILIYLEPLLADEDLRIRCSAIVGLWQFPDLRGKLLNFIKEIFRDKSPEAEECTIFLVEHLNLLWGKSIIEGMLGKGSEKRQIYAFITLIKLGERNYVKPFLEKILLFEKNNQHELIEFILTKYRYLPEKIKKFILKQMRNAEELDKLTFYMVFNHSHYIFQNELDDLSW